MGWDWDEGGGSARRCSICSIDWPDSKEYKICPSCLDEDGTDRCKDVTPMDAAEAKSLRLHLEFERFYEKWDREHDPERLVPDPDQHWHYYCV